MLLAAEGWRVRRSDLSPAAIAEARWRVAAKDLAAPFAVTDLYESTPLVTPPSSWRAARSSSICPTLSGRWRS